VASGTLQVELVSPAKPLFRGAAAGVVAEAHDGEMGILPGHAPLVALLGTGVVRVRTGAGATEAFAIRGGFVQVLSGRVSLVVTEAIAATDVDREKARAALDRTLADLAHPKSGDEFARLLDERRWCEAQLKIAGRR
jgi:F-type H+-transporting ATPase subunit epsilon